MYLYDPVIVYLFNWSFNFVIYLYEPVILLSIYMSLKL